jgi:hypothetical protein
MRLHRLVRLVAASACLAVAASGCAAVGAAGQSEESAQARLEETPGVQSARVSTSGVYSGLARSSGTTVQVTLDEGYTVADADGVLRWALATGWSTGDEEPNSSLQFTLLDSDGSPAEWDWAGATSALGVEGDNVDLLIDKGVVSYVVDDRLRDLLGDWPGDVPETPDDLFVAG